jgi:type II secretory pathway component GspD/PulD (secretin)
MKVNCILRLAVLPILLATVSCGEAETSSLQQEVAPEVPETLPVMAEGQDFAEGVGADLVSEEIQSDELAVMEVATPELEMPETVAPPDADETSISNAVAAAVAAAVAVEETKAAVAAQERAEAREEAARIEAKADAALARRRISTKVFKLEHASAEEVAEKLNATWSGDFGAVWKISKMAIAFPESNSVMVTAPAAIIEACEEVVKSVDVEPKQVYIEARFVELGNKASHKLGIDWSMLDGMSGTSTLGGGINTTRLGKGVSNYSRQVDGKTDGRTVMDSYTLAGTGSSDGDITYFNGTLSFSEMRLVLMALDATDDVRTFSNPKIIVSSGKKATVDMTTKYPNVAVSAKRTLNGNAESLDLAMNMAAIPGEDKMMFAREAFFSWGISLDVVPRIGTNDLINVAIVPTISDLDTNFGSGGFVTADDDSSPASSSYSSKYPIVKMQRLVTEFNMASGSTAVIGGLSRTVETQQDSGIPWLRTWPWIGPKLFGSKVRVKEQREIIVFVTVGLVDPKDIRKDAGLPKNAVLGRQYTKGQKLEPGDRPGKNLEGIGSLDFRSLEEQAQDPLPPPDSGTSMWIPFSNGKSTKESTK